MSRSENSLQSVWLDKILASANNIPTEEWIKNKLSNPTTWWHNPTNYNSLRLNRTAWMILQHAPKDQFNFVKFELLDYIKPKTLLQLEKYFTAPYYIQNLKTIYCCGETEVLMLSLHGNNLQQYLDNYTC